MRQIRGLTINMIQEDLDIYIPNITAIKFSKKKKKKYVVDDIITIIYRQMIFSLQIYMKLYLLLNQFRVL